MEPALQQSLNSLLRFRPRKRGQKRVEAVKEPIGTWQGDLINEVLRGRDRTPIEGGNPARERVDEAVQLGVGKCSVDIPISLRGIAVEVVRAEHDFKRPTAADQQGQAFRAAATGIHSHSDFGLAQPCVLARREAHVAGEDEFAARAPDAASDLRDADDRGPGEADERIRQDRQAGSTDGYDCALLPKEHLVFTAPQFAHSKL